MLADDRRTVRCTNDGVTISATVAGDGPPILLLHGYPETHLMWRHVVPALAERHTVVAADLRGYGDSDKPAPTPTGEVYAKRAMALDQLALMHSLGFDRFDVVGHDRGARVAHRLALDHEEAVGRIAVLDVVPTLHMFEHVDRAMASSYFHWFFLALQNGLPERLIGADPEAWLRSRFTGRNAGGRPIDDDASADYLRCFRTPEGIAASTADYQSAATIDLEHDRADREAGRRVRQPLFALWGSSSYVGQHFDVPAVWAQFADRVSGTAIHADHYLAEEAPEETASALLGFLHGGEDTDR